MKTVAILALENVVPLDLTIPLEIFSRARTLKNKPCYHVSVCGPKKAIQGSHMTYVLHGSLDSLSSAHTIVIPGTEDPTKALPAKIREQLITAYKNGARIISICSGVFHLAETGLLDGLTATTHWLCVDLLQKNYPGINVDPNVLYVDEGRIMTSAGACAGIDLCLHIVRKDFGASVAAHSARLAVMPLERSGGQAQHIVHAIPAKGHGSLSHILEWAESNLQSNLSLEAMAAKAFMSTRTLNRQFKKQTGTSPLKWVLHTRIRRARELLETTQYSMESIAAEVGFGSPITMRDHFKAMVHTTPKSYRDSFQKTV